MANITEQDARLRRFERLVQAGVDPYPPYHEFDGLRLRHIVSNPPPEGQHIQTAGRVMRLRRHGGLVFVDLVQDNVRLQHALRRDQVGEIFFNEFLDRTYVGDIIGCEGSIFHTRRGELTVDVESYQILSVCLRPIPGNRGFDGLSDVEQRYRNRHLDLLTNPRTQETLRFRSIIIHGLRSYLLGRGFVEVETPILQSIYGGANAQPFVTRLNATEEDRFLRISPELYLKRLVVGGMERVFEIGRQFRNEDIDVTHNPEFTSLEVYQAYCTYQTMMDLVENLVVEVANQVADGLEVEFQLGSGPTQRIDLSPPWRRVQFMDALELNLEQSPTELTDGELGALLNQHYGRGMESLPRGVRLAKLFDAVVEPRLVQPTIVSDYPRETSPLCRPHRADPTLIERFELFIGGMELANAYSELNDPNLQFEAFRLAELRNHVTQPYDWSYCESLAYGMPPTGGLGLGVDRLVMLLTSQPSIKEVITFPLVREQSSLNTN